MKIAYSLDNKVVPNIRLVKNLVVSLKQSGNTVGIVTSVGEELVPVLEKLLKSFGFPPPDFFLYKGTESNKVFSSLDGSDSLWKAKVVYEFGIDYLIDGNNEDIDYFLAFHPRKLIRLG